MKAFRINGRFRMGRGWQPFSKELAAADEAGAREKLLSILGSQHGVPRKYVSIGSDLLVYDDIKQQIERLDGRIKSITDAANAIGQRLGELQRRAEAQGAAVQDLYDRLQAKGAPGERN